MSYWLLKTEPDVFGIEHLMKSPRQITGWEGVRNYQARNFMRDGMQLNDLAFFYHSNCKAPGIVAIVKIVKTAYPDNTAFNPESKYYDPKSDLSKPRWYQVDVKLERRLKRSISLDELRKNLALKNMILLRKGNRLSVSPVTANEWQAILGME